MTWPSARRWRLRVFSCGRGRTSSSTRSFVGGVPAGSRCLGGRLGGRPSPLRLLPQRRFSPQRPVNARRSVGRSTRMAADFRTASLRTSASLVGVVIRGLAAPRGLLRPSAFTSLILRGGGPGHESRTVVLWCSSDFLALWFYCGPFGMLVRSPVACRCFLLGLLRFSIILIIMIALRVVFGGLCLLFFCVGCCLPFSVYVGL